MKRTVLILAVLLLTGCAVLLFRTSDWTQTVSLGTIPEAGSAAAESGAGEDEDALLLALSYEGFVLPVNDDGSVLIPFIPESGLTVTAARSAALTRTEAVSACESGDYRAVTVTAAKGGKSRTLTLRETHLPVMYITVNEPEISKDREPFGNKNKRANVSALYPAEDGRLVYETGDVRIRLRGNSSRGYVKKGYTFTNVDEHNNVVDRSFLGYPADTKFGLNSLFEDDVKIRDILSLDVCASTLPDDTDDRVLLMKHTELYINGVYWGLYGLKQIITPGSAGIGPEDGLVKMNASFFTSEPITKEEHDRLKPYVDVRQEIPGGDVADLFLSVFEKLSENDPSATRLIDRDSLLRYGLWLQIMSSLANTSKNIIGVWRAEKACFSLMIYDTDQTFGFTWDVRYPPGYCRVDPTLTTRNMLKTKTPFGHLIQIDPENMTALAELYFSLRDGVLSEETLRSRAHFLFARAADSGAMARDRLRWPSSPCVDTSEQVETYITERLAWCDDYFSGFLAESLPAA